MARRPLLPPLLLALALAASSVIGVAEAGWWHDGWRHVFRMHGRHGHGHGGHGGGGGYGGNGVNGGGGGGGHGGNGGGGGHVGDGDCGYGGNGVNGGGGGGGGGYGGGGGGGHGGSGGGGRHGGDGDCCSNVSSIVTEQVYASLFLHKDDPACLAKNFYNYSAFIAATERFPEFGSDGHDKDTRLREVAAFLAQISHETTGGWPTAPDGPYSWGLCFKEEINPPSNYCANSTDWPCVDGKSYHGRGPMQLSWNYNYGPAGKALGFDGLGNPEVVASDPVVAFKAALWFWMTPQPPKPSCHDVMVGRYVPTEGDKAANRTAGFGLTTNIINGKIECNRIGDARVADRIGFYDRYCHLLNVSDVGMNLDCAQQLPYS